MYSPCAGAGQAGYELRLDSWDTSATYTAMQAALVAEQKDIINVCLTYTLGSTPTGLVTTQPGTAGISNAVAANPSTLGAADVSNPTAALITSPMTAGLSIPSGADLINPAAAGLDDTTAALINNPVAPGLHTPVGVDPSAVAQPHVGTHPSAGAHHHVFTQPMPALDAQPAAMPASHYGVNWRPARRLRAGMLPEEGGATRERSRGRVA